MTPHPDEVFRVRRPDRRPAHDPQDEIADLALVLTTSGTTGEPKVVPLRHANLLSSIDRIVASLGLSPEDRSLVVMPLTHIHGMVAGFLAPLAAGGTVFLGGRFDPVTLPDAAATFGATLVTAVPTIHRALAETPADRAWSERLRLVRSSSSALPVSVAESLERRFGVPVIEAYGMTEAAHQITSNTVDDPRRGTVGRADGARVRVIDDNGHRLEPDRIGDVVIRGENVMGGYIADDVVNDAAFIDGWFRTGDRGRIDPDGHLVLVGRTKEMINRGGETIAPGPIEEVLRSVAGVRDAVVFAAPHPTLGEQVAAAVVADPNDSVPVDRLQQEVNRRLGAADVPRIVHTVDEIPVGPTGKVQRNLLPGLLGVTSEQREGGSFTDLEAEVAAVWQTVGLTPVGPGDDFIALGGDSLMAITVAIELSARWQVDIRPTDILWDSTVLGMAMLRNRPRERESTTSRVPHGGPTPAQRRLIAADRLGLDRRTENMAFAWRVSGTVDPPRLRGAIEAVIDRHPALRSTFAPPPLPAFRAATTGSAYSWTTGNVVVDEHQATAAFGALAAEPYDLADGPLLRFGLWPIHGDRSWVFGFAYHHVVLDGRSRRIVLDDLARAFDDALPSGEVLRACAVGSSLAPSDRDWWRARAQDVPVELAWTTRLVGRDTDSRALVERIALDTAVVAALRRCAVAHQATPTTVLVAATALAVGRLTGEKTVVVGLPIDHRTGGCDDAVGSTMDAVPVIVDVGTPETVTELLAAVRRECLEAFQRSEAGLQEIREAAGRSSGEPLIHVRAQVRTTSERLSLGDLRSEPLLIDPVAARTPVAVDLRMTDDTPTLEVTFDSSVVVADVTAAYARSLAVVLHEVAHGSDEPLRDLDWVSEIDRSSVERWGDGGRSEPAFATISEWFDTCLDRWPNRVAIRTSDRTVTFRDLADVVRRATAGLLERTDPGDVVAMALPRGIDHIAIQLAVWRSGRVGVAVAPDAPTARTRAQLRVTAPRLVVVTDGAPRAADGFDLVVVEDLVSGGADLDSVSYPDPHAPAWVCVTSGSTGQPATVIGTQSNLVHLVHGWHQIVPLEAHGVASVSKPVSAVGLLSEWLVPLLAGNELFLFNAVVARDPFRIATRISEAGVTWYRGTPAMLDAVASTVLANDGPNDRVRFVVSGADVLSRPTADLVQRAFPSATIVNQYGCTEATAESTLGPIIPGDHQPDVGRPLANVRVEVVDDTGRRVPPGVGGEIVIRGPLVAGASTQGEHASGDFGWWDGGGRLHFSGRRDRRLSVKGNRIDAGDVEAALRATGLVGSAVVMVDPDETRSRDLAAVVTLENGRGLADVRAAAASALPLFAVPNRIRVVDALPTLPSGKIDLRAARVLLDEPEPETPAPLAPEVADIRAMVAGVLRRAPSTVDPARSLQANGGDSFAAIALHEQLRSINGDLVDIAALLDDRPLRELATRPSASLGDRLPGRLRRVAVGRFDDRRVVWFPGGGGLDTEVRRLVHHLPSPPEVLVYPYPGSAVGEHPSLWFRRLTKRIVATLLDLDGPPPILAGNSFGGIVAAEVAHQLQQRRRGWIRGLLIVDAMPVEQRRAARRKMIAGHVRSDLRLYLAERRSDDTAPAVRWRRNYRASRLMLAGHTHTRRVSGVSVVVVATTERRTVTGHPDLGWGAHLGDQVEVIVLPGDHGGLLVEPRVLETAPMVAEALRRLAPPRP